MSQDDVTEEQIKIRVEKLMADQRLIELEKAEEVTAAERKKLEKEAKDRRTTLLNAVRAGAPDVSTALFDKMQSLEYEGQDFTKRDIVDLLKAHGAQLKDSQDFFDLNVAQREDLLDRVGFYRGVIIDHGLSNPVELSFREVLMRPDTEKTTSEGQSTDRAARLLYRKPNFSGYFENYFTTSEATHQTQKNGVTNLKFSLAAATGMVATVGVGVSGSYHQQSQVSAGSVGKKTYITANFFLPRIELSFDSLTPCASTDFEKACAKAMAKKEEERFAELKKVLDSFGHFVSTHTLVGGRLFATETKVFKANESKSNVTQRFAAELKVSLSTPAKNAELNISGDHGTQIAQRDKTSDEEQNLTFHAVGGEGTVVQNAAVWAESLYDYRRWAAVQRENLIPSINVLPEDLAESCWNTLKNYAEKRTKRTILFEDDAYFLFYGEYGDTVGSLAKEAYFSIQNLKFDAAVSLRSALPIEGEVLALTKPSPDTSPAQLWRMTEDGKLVSFATKPPGAYGIQKDVLFALTAEITGEPTADKYPVSIRQLGKSDFQTWEYPGSGELINSALGKDYLLDAENDKQLVLRKRTSISENSRLWDLIELPLYLAEALRKTAAHSKTNKWFKLRIAEGGLVMSINRAEGKTHLSSVEHYHIVAQPDINGPHQMWRLDERDQIVSAMMALDSGNELSVLLSVSDNSRFLLAKPYSPDLQQKWKINAGYLVPLSGNFANDAAAIKVTGGREVKASFLEMVNRDRKAGQKWTTEELGENLAFTEYEQKMLGGELRNDWVKMVDTRPLDVNGYLTGIRLVLTERGSFYSINEGYALQLAVDVRRESSKPTIAHNAPPNESMVDISNDANVSVNSQLLYLPDTPVFSIKLAVENQQLGFMYQLVKDGPWVAAESDSNRPGQLQLKNIKTATSKISVLVSERIIALGLDFYAEHNVLVPRVIKTKS